MTGNSTHHVQQSSAAMDPLINSMASFLSIQPGLLKPALILISSYIFAFLFPLLPKGKHGSIRHIYSVCISVGMFTALFGQNGIWQLLLGALVVYFITYFWGRKPWAPVLCFIITLGHLTLR